MNNIKIRCDELIKALDELYSLSNCKLSAFEHKFDETYEIAEELKEMIDNVEYIEIENLEEKELSNSLLKFNKHYLDNKYSDKIKGDSTNDY